MFEAFAEVWLGALVLILKQIFKTFTYHERQFSLKREHFYNYSLFQATVNTYNSIACLDAKSYYTRFMTKELREKSSNSSIDGLKKVHEKHLSVSIAQVGISRKILS